MCAHGCRLTGKMNGAGLRSVAWASVITLVESSVITLPRLAANPTSSHRSASASRALRINPRNSGLFLKTRRHAAVNQRFWYSPSHLTGRQRLPSWALHVRTFRVAGYSPDFEQSVERAASAWLATTVTGLNRIAPASPSGDPPRRAYVDGERSQRTTPPTLRRRNACEESTRPSTASARREILPLVRETPLETTEAGPQATLEWTHAVSLTAMDPLNSAAPSFRRVRSSAC